MKKKTEQKTQKEFESPLPTPNVLTEQISILLNRLFANVELEFDGVENLQSVEGPLVIIAAPHNGHTDSPVLMRAFAQLNRKIRNKVFFLSAAGYWDTGVKGKLSQLAIRNLPIHRKGKKRIEKDKEMVVEHIQAGQIPVLFGEGTRSRDPKKPMSERKIKTGAVQFAIATKDIGTQVLPVYIEGAGEMMPVGSSWPKTRPKKGAPKFKVTVTFGRPIPVGKMLPENYDQLPERQQYSIIRGITSGIHGFFVAQEEFDSRGTDTAEPY